ncbi:hypothetical protein CC80DRAFT_457341, partial [Byssothecium circinans]
MYQKLPRELRDMIYHYLYISKTPILIGSYHFSTYSPPISDWTTFRSSLPHNPSSQYAHALISGLGPEAVKHDHSTVPPQDTLLPTDHTLDPAYVGREMAYEASHFYYSKNTFSICTVGDTMRTFLTNDVAYNFPNALEGSLRIPLGIIPRDYIRNLQIRIKYEHFDAYRFRYLQEDFSREQGLVQETFTNLEALKPTELPEKPPPNQNIEFIIMTAFQNDSIRFPQPGTDAVRRLTNLLEAIRNPIYALQHDLNAEISVLHHDEECFAFPRPMTGLFSMSKEDWEY